jgi:hypothetical protein
MALLENGETRVGDVALFLGVELLPDPEGGYNSSSGSYGRKFKSRTGFVLVMQILRRWPLAFLREPPVLHKAFQPILEGSLGYVSECSHFDVGGTTGIAASAGFSSFAPACRAGILSVPLLRLDVPMLNERSRAFKRENVRDQMHCSIACGIWLVLPTFHSPRQFCISVWHTAFRDGHSPKRHQSDRSHRK